jgi:hypothetical protein
MFRAFLCPSSGARDYISSCAARGAKDAGGRMAGAGQQVKRPEREVCSS